MEKIEKIMLRDIVLKSGIIFTKTQDKHGNVAKNNVILVEIL